MSPRHLFLTALRPEKEWLSQAGTGCVRDGEIELMVHRRLLKDVCSFIIINIITENHFKIII